MNGMALLPGTAFIGSNSSEDAKINKLAVVECVSAALKSKSLVFLAFPRDDRPSFTGNHIGFGASVSAHCGQSWWVLELVEFFGDHSSTMRLCVSVSILYLCESVARTPHSQQYRAHPSQLSFSLR
jgi:hypothetical protein